MTLCPCAGKGEMVVLDFYGLKNCDSCRKALKWLDAKGFDVRFHDIRQCGLNADDIAGFAARAGWQKLLNRRSASWRALDKSQTAQVDERAAIALMAQNPTLIKRPVICGPDHLSAGFDATVEAALAELAGGGSI